MKAAIFKPVDISAIEQAAQILKKGGLVVFPTETVYGLGADAYNPKAVARIFQAKRRPAFDPLIVHVCDIGQTKEIFSHIPSLAKKLMKEFWPGPLTLVLPKSKKVPDIVTSGLESVAVRMPSHPTALSLIKKLGRPIAAPSANLFGRTSPTTAQAAAEDLGNRIDMVLDDGPCSVGVESTILKLEKNGTAVLLRPGGVSVEDIQKFCTVKKNPLLKKHPAPFSEKKKRCRVLFPGQMESHYAPQTPFVLMNEPVKFFTDHLEKKLEVFRKKRAVWPRIGALVFRRPLPTTAVAIQMVLSPKGDLAEAASNLFQMIRQLDKLNMDLMVAEPVWRRGLGLAIMDRLEKAAAKKKGVDHFLKAWEKRSWKVKS